MGDTISNLWQTSDRELVEAVVVMETQLRQTYSSMLQLLSELESRGVATKLGYSNTSALLMHVLRISRTEARHRIAQADDLLGSTTPTGSVIEASLPLTGEALAKGDIGVESVDVIRKTLKGLSDLDPAKRTAAEETMLDEAADNDPRALARFGTQVRDMVDPDGPPPPDPNPRPPRQFLLHTRTDGITEFKGHLDAENGHLLKTLLKPFEKPNSEGGDTRGYAERSGDAFVEVLKMAANCPELPTHNGVRTEVAFTIDIDVLRRSLNDAILPGDSYLTAREARRIACDCHALPAIMSGDSKPLDVAVPAYVVPAHIRRGLVLRDRGCAFPGCERPGSVCDAHHILHWLGGGLTQIENLVLLCPHHHRLIHHSEWEVQMVNKLPHFIPPTYVDATRRPRRNALRRTLPTAA